MFYNGTNYQQGFHMHSEWKDIEMILQIYERNQASYDLLVEDGDAVVLHRNYYISG